MRKIVILLGVMLVSSCANLVQVKVDVVDQRTALENQVLGTYQEIGEDAHMFASVRSIDEQGRLIPSPPISKGRKKSIAAMQRSEFNKDDIEQFKSIGFIGENKKGYLTWFPPEEDGADQKQLKLAQNVLKEENEDRLALYMRIVDINEEFDADDLSKVETIMAGLNRDVAKPGERIELDSGKWIFKRKK